MPPEILLSAIMGGANTAGNLFSSWLESRTARQNTDKTIAANKAMAEYQYSKDLEMWNRQNDYNSPLNQMSRFEAAGLNKNLIYGQGTSGNAVQMPKYNAPTLQYNYKPPVNTSGMLQSYQDMQLRQAQIDNVKASTNTQITENALKALNVDYYNMVNQYRAAEAANKPLIQIENKKRLILENEMFKKSMDTKLGMYQQDLKRKVVENAMLQIDQNWQKAEKWLGVSRTAGQFLGGAGIASAINRRLRR